ncbi:MAG: hypothetical protein HY885_01170 [Deltaproteobacteria bacterium]|nr:hypothetical protein [Deltaproteobacteria bacterium]
MTFCCRITLSILFFLLPTATQAASAGDEPITISMPAEIIRQTIRDALPIPIDTQGKSVEGSIVVSSLNKLQFKDKSIVLQGVVSGRDLAMSTNLGGQNIRMKLGNVELPVSCELFLRFDKKKKILFVTPHFSKPEKKPGNETAEALFPLLTALGGREFPVDFETMAPFSANVGTREIAFRLEPVDIQTGKDMLVIKMRPKVL